MPPATRSRSGGCGDCAASSVPGRRPPRRVDLGTIPNTRWQRLNLRLRRRLDRWFGQETTYKLDPPEPCDARGEAGLR
jgi:hypothetical protein